ncbi:hypothetical protein [Paenibacillus alkalitolerans]|uniref:hypothetical protein n=1 Tax=Paenibacillus alkalitolerans TaxID=2799335 RepID=UPI0018F65C69|nr:hypothetical protein [Paenibacillus alkalitolerans]
MNMAKGLSAEAQQLHMPIQCEGKAGYLIADAACKARMEPDGGMSLTNDDDRYFAWSDREYRTPLLIEATVKTDSTNIRMKYGAKGNLIFNWEVQPDTLILSNPATNQENRAKRAGTVPIDSWVQVRWLIDEGRMSVVVDHVERFAMKGNFAGMSEKVAIGAAWGSRVTVKSVRVVELPGGKAAPEGVRMLHGLVPDGQAPGVLGCLRGVLHYWNRYIPDPRFFALAGGAGALMIGGERIWGEQLLEEHASTIGIVPERLGAVGSLTAEIRKSIDDGCPCLMFDAEVADFVLIAGYNETGCIVRSADLEAVRHWDGFRNRDQTAVYRLTPGVERDAFRSLVDMMVRPLPPDPGVAALDACIHNVETGNYEVGALAYLAAFWSKCRLHSSEFLYETSGMSGSAASLLLEAAECMRSSGNALERLHQAVGEKDAAAALLKEIRQAEQQKETLLCKAVDLLKQRKELLSYRFTGLHMSHAGALRACLDVLPAEPVTNAWLYGATGYAFVMALDEHITNRGPTFGLPYGHLHRLAANIGLKINGIRVYTDSHDHHQWRSRAIQGIRQAIDAGLPCFGQGLAETSETEVLHGYEPQGYLTHGWHQRGLPIPWEALGMAYCPCVPCSGRRKEQFGENVDVQSGFISVHWAEAVQASDAESTVRQAFSYILEQNSGSPGTSLPGYLYGTDAYEHWIRVVKEGNAVGFYVGYLCDTWRECRSYAAPFLREAASKLDPDWTEALEEAARYYDASASKWKRLNELYPWMQPRSKVVDVDKRMQTVELLEGIMASEQAGMRIIEEIYRKI